MVTRALSSPLKPFLRKYISRFDANVLKHIGISGFMRTKVLYRPLFPFTGIAEFMRSHLARGTASHVSVKERSLAGVTGRGFARICCTKPCSGGSLAPARARRRSFAITALPTPSTALVKFLQIPGNWSWKSRTIILFLALACTNLSSSHPYRDGIDTPYGISRETIVSATDY